MADNNLQAAIDWLKSPQRTQQVQGIGFSLEQAINNLHASRVKDEQLWNQAFQDPTQPLKVTDQAAFNEMTQRTMGGPMGFAPVGMVVGRGVTQEAIARANQLLNINASPGKILQETGLVQVPTKDGFTWGKQISDAPLNVDLNKLNSSDYREHAYVYGVKNPVSVGDAITHPELFNLYPELKKMSLFKNPENVASFSPVGEGMMSLPATKYVPENYLEKKLQQVNSYAAHELQHAIQELEGWPRGGNSQEFMGKAYKAVKSKADEAMQNLEGATNEFLQKQGLTAPKDFKSFVQSVSYIKANGPKYLEDVGPESRKRIQAILSSNQADTLLNTFNRVENAYKKIDQKTKKANTQYMSLAGEAQSNAVEKQFLENNYKNPLTGYYNQTPDSLIYKDPMGFTIK